MTNITPETGVELIIWLVFIFIICLFILVLLIFAAGTLYIMVNITYEWIKEKEEENHHKNDAFDDNSDFNSRKQQALKPTYTLLIVFGILLFIYMVFELYNKYWDTLSDNSKIVVLFLPLVVSIVLFLYILIRRPYLMPFQKETTMESKIVAVLFIIIYFLMLIIIPCNILYEKPEPLTEEVTYKMKVNVIGPYQFADDDRYIMIMEIPFPALVSPAKNVLLFKDENDFVIDVLNNTSDTHAAGYVKQLLIAGYTMTDLTGSIEEQQKAIAEGDVIYYVIRVRNGNYVMEGLYVDGVPIEEYGK